MSDPSETEEDAFDPNSYYQIATDQMSKEVNELISIILRNSLSRKRRKLLSKEFLKPSHSTAQIPDADNVLIDFMGEQFPRNLTSS